MEKEHEAQVKCNWEYIQVIAEENQTQHSSEAEQGFLPLTAGSMTAVKCGQLHDTALLSFEAGPGHLV